MSDGIHGHGTTLSIGGTNVGNIINVGGPDESRDSIDISTMDSLNKWREFIPGMIDAGEVSMELNYDGSTTGVLLHAQLTQTAQSIVVTFDATATNTFTCLGFMTGLGQATPFDDKVTQSVTIKFTGEPTYA